jgi:SAM-dependent methyltransferase
VGDDVADLKQRNRALWASGHWDAVASVIEALGPRLLDRVGVEPGIELLDVGTGSGGTIAIPAARRGAVVTGVDLTPELFEDARRRAADAGVEVDWVEGDAEALPFEDGRFDLVVSTFGHMFAPRHARAGAELARVCRPGGTVATTTWTPEGMVGTVLRTLAARLPAPPAFADSPVLWGREEHVRAMLEPHGLELDFDHDAARFEYGDLDGFLTFYADNFGPLVTARAVLGESWPALRTELRAVFEERNQARDGSLRIDSEYLVTIGRKAG